MMPTELERAIQSLSTIEARSKAVYNQMQRNPNHDLSEDLIDEAFNFYNRPNRPELRVAAQIAEMRGKPDVAIQIYELNHNYEDAFEVAMRSEGTLEAFRLFLNTTRYPPDLEKLVQLAQEKEQVESLATKAIEELNREIAGDIFTLVNNPQAAHEQYGQVLLQNSLIIDEHRPTIQTLETEMDKLIETGKGPIYRGDDIWIASSEFEFVELEYKRELNKTLPSAHTALRVLKKMGREEQALLLTAYYSNIFSRYKDVQEKFVDEAKKLLKTDLPKEVKADARTGITQAYAKSKRFREAESFLYQFGTNRERYNFLVEIFSKENPRPSFPWNRRNWGSREPHVPEYDRAFELAKKLEDHVEISKFYVGERPKRFKTDDYNSKRVPIARTLSQSRNIVAREMHLDGEDRSFVLDSWSWFLEAAGKYVYEGNLEGAEQVAQEAGFTVSRESLTELTSEDTFNQLERIKQGTYRRNPIEFVRQPFIPQEWKQKVIEGEFRSLEKYDLERALSFARQIGDEARVKTYELLV